jgi:glycosyltransferase involved in cell wall biosynthesis
MRLLVDDSAAFNQGAGIGRYARNVLPAAVRRLPSARVTLWYAPSGPGPAPFGQATSDGFRGMATPRIRRSPLSRRRMDQLWFRARMPLPVQVLAGPADLIYSPDFTAPPSGRTPRVVTVHDLAFIVRPESAPAALRRYLSAVVPRQIEGAARVVAVSEATRRDLIERLGADPARIALVPNGVEDRFFAPSPLAEATRARLGVPADYLLTVGTLEPRKNHQQLFRAIELLDGRAELPLVVAGRPGWDFEPILRAAEPLRRRGRIILLDYVPDAELPGLYAGAAAVVYPSWYEGFGLPVVEALAAGVPVVASDVPALVEVAGNSAILVDPGRPEAIAEAIERSLGPEQRSDAECERRRRQARRYSWDASGEILARVFADVVGCEYDNVGPRLI